MEYYLDLTRIPIRESEVRITKFGILSSLQDIDPSPPSAPRGYSPYRVNFHLPVGSKFTHVVSALTFEAFTFELKTRDDLENDPNFQVTVL